MDNMNLGTLKDTEKIFCLKEDERINAELRKLARFQCDTKILETCNFLLSIKADNVDLLRKKEWMFNKGNVRDISKWEKIKRDYPVNYTPAWGLGFVPGFLLFIFLCIKWDLDGFLIFAVLCPILLISMWIASLIYYIGSKNYVKYLKKIEKEGEVSQAEATFAVKQLKEARGAVIATTAACAHTVRCAKNAQKELDNPGKWKKI